MPRRIRPTKPAFFDWLQLLMHVIRMCMTMDDPFA